MNFATRVQMLFAVKADAALDHLEDQRQAMNGACTRQQDLLRQLRRGLIEVAMARQELKDQARTLRAQLSQLEAQATPRDDLPGLALQREQAWLAELSGLEAQLADLAEAEQELTLAEQQFARRVDRLRSRRDAVAALCNAAEAQMQTQEALSEVPAETHGWRAALERAEIEIGQMRSRATALEALLKTSMLTPPGHGLLEPEVQEPAGCGRQGVGAQTVSGAGLHRSQLNSSTSRPLPAAPR